MTDRIFETYAPAYWNAGLPVIPLRQRNKMPDIMQWSVYGSRMPDQLEMNHWMASFPNGNIGLPLGSASGICVIDVDTENETLIATIRAICGPSPWVRVGKKGMALAYQFENQRNFKLRGAEDLTRLKRAGICLDQMRAHPQLVARGAQHLVGDIQPV